MRACCARLLCPLTQRKRRKPRPDLRGRAAYLKRGYFSKALETFQRVRTYYRDDPASVLAQLAIADVHFRKGDYEQARYAYDEFATYHPRHEAMDYVVYRIGLSVYKRAPKMAGRDQAATLERGERVGRLRGAIPRFAIPHRCPRARTRSRERLAHKELQIAQFYAQRDAWGAVRGRAKVSHNATATPRPWSQRSRFSVKRSTRGGTPRGAEGARDRLTADYPDSKWIKSLNAALAKPAGEPPEERAVFRPYRVQGGMQQAPPR